MMYHVRVTDRHGGTWVEEYAEEREAWEDYRAWRNNAPTNGTVWVEMTAPNGEEVAHWSRKEWEEEQEED